jgi:hypothetical protein
MPGTIGLTSKTTSPARTVPAILSDSELFSFDLRPPRAPTVSVVDQIATRSPPIVH